MRKLLSFCLCLACIATTAQDKIYNVKPGEMIADVLKNEDKFLYPSFQPGKVIFKSGETAAGLMNYTFMSGEILFMDNKGDTMALTNEGTIKMLTLGKDSFYFDKGYIRFITGNDQWKLGKKQQLRIVKQDRAGAYDQNMPSASVSYTSVRVGNQLMDNLIVRENTTLMNQTDYYIGDKFNRFEMVNKKNIMKFFSKHERAIENYLDQQQVNFKKEEDIRKLFAFLQTL